MAPGVRPAGPRAVAGRLLAAQAAWGAVVLAVWVGALLALPLDPDYTSGELLDHLLAWRAGEPLYAPPSAAPYRVLNYPPTVLALARLLAGAGVEPLAAGRLLGTAGVLLALAAVVAWLREGGLTARVALGVAAIGAACFPILYAAGQFHVEGLAAAGTAAGFWLAGRGPRGNTTARGVAAGALLAAACLVKQPQVVLSLVALAWVWRDRGRAGWPVYAAYAATGLAGCAAITLAFGAEAWRHLLTYTVGTFSWRQLALQLVSNALPWAGLALFAFAAAFGRASAAVPPGDARRWYLAGSTVWLLSAARLGASYQYFLDWHLALLVCVGPWVARWAGGERIGWGTRPHPTVASASSVPNTLTANVVRFLGAAFVAQVALADIVVAGVLAYDVTVARRTALALPALCPHVPPAPALTVSESAAVVRACGGRPALHPFIMANLAERGLWDEAPFVHALEGGAFAAAILPFDPAAGARGALTVVQSERWTPRMVAAMASAYRTAARAGEWWVLVPARRAAASGR